MTIQQYIDLVKYVKAECEGISANFDVHTGALVFSIDNCGSGGEYTFTRDELADEFLNGKTPGDIVGKAQWYVEAEFCEVCETFEQDREIMKVGDDYQCSDCFDDLIVDRDYEDTLDSLRGREI